MKLDKEEEKKKKRRGLYERKYGGFVRKGAEDNPAKIYRDRSSLEECQKARN